MTEDQPPTTHSADAVAHNAAAMARVLAGIQSLHSRLDVLEGATQAAREDRAPRRQLPAWRLPSNGEARWQVSICTAVAIALQLPIHGRLSLVHPDWILPAVQGLLLIGLVMANPHRINRESRALRSLALTLGSLLSVVNAYAAASLVVEIVQGKAPSTAGPLLATGASIWLTNVIVFALWYWEFDQGGPVARALATERRYPDFLFANMTVADDPDLCQKGWKPAFGDYLYLSFTNATAFSPTDTLPLSRWAKLAMTLQSIVSLVTVALVVARAVNIFQLCRVSPVGRSSVFGWPAVYVYNVLAYCACMLLPTSLVGSYPQPEWLIDRAKLAGRFPPRVRARELWRVDPDYLAQAQDDATLLAIRAQEDAGLDILTDGEIRRESYSNRFATALDGVDIDNPGTALDRSGHPNPVPRIVGPIRRRHPVEVDDLKFLRAHTDAAIKITVPGPFTMAQQAQDDHYGSREDLAFGYAEAVNEEIRDLFAAGADIVQLDEPYLQARAAEAKQYGVKVINRALDGITGTTALHICFGYAAIIHDRPEGYSFLPELAACDVDQVSIETAQSRLDVSVLTALEGKTVILGVIDLSDPNVETAETVAARVRRALPYVPAERIVVATDCGMKYLPRESANGKMRAMADAAALLRAELAGS
jgi:5-methyltetrahydropteroyltriglutamate--homocysteine methyltransferase